MIEIELNNIYIHYGFKNILNGLNIEVKTKERIAIVGQNGSGKTTLLKIIAGIEKPDLGNINIRRDANIGLLNQIYKIEKDDLNVRDFLMNSFKEINQIEKELKDIENKMSLDNSNLENLLRKYGNLQEKFISIGGYEIQEKFSKICTGFKITEELLKQNYNKLSGGEKTRINLAALLLKNPDILLLDEPTNHLDIESLEWLEDVLKNYNGTIVIVSHDRYFLDKIATKTILIENGKEKVYFGNYSYFLKEDERRTLQEFNIYKNQQKQIEKMKESIATLRKFGELAGNEMFYKRAHCIEKRLEKMQTVEKVTLEKRQIKLDINFDERSGNKVITGENLYKKFSNKEIFNNVKFDINFGEKICLMGENGSGKSTLIKMIIEQDNDYTGNLKIGNSVKIGYIPQEIHFPNSEETILEYFSKEYKGDSPNIRTVLARFMFRKDDVLKKLKSLSGGEKVRLLLAILIYKNSNFLILDEPTNHIDIQTREMLEECLQNYKGTILFISHDRYFINALADRILKIENCEIYSYTGNYDSYKNSANKNV